jgi:uncharacterized protein YcbK (DUF882 family)
MAMMKLILGMMVVMMVLSSNSGCESEASTLSRFVFSGDGWINLKSKKNGRAFAGTYRKGCGEYDPEALKKIYRVFDAPYDPEAPRLSLRLLEYLDYLEDHLRSGARIVVTSGYRSPDYNAQVRKGGRLAAKASLHQYGMAADIIMDGVSPLDIWETVKGLHFGGAGYYHGKTVHVDVGPARYWDETSSGVDTGISDDNKLIGIVTHYDRYFPGEELILQFIRMTAFPIGVDPVFGLMHESAAAETIAFKPVFTIPIESRCPQFTDIDQLNTIRWRLDQKLPPGRYVIQARFCHCPWEHMPLTVQSPVFEIVQP